MKMKRMTVAPEETLETTKRKKVSNDTSKTAINFVNAMDEDELTLRTKTHVQLQIIDDETKKSCCVVVSGAMDLKKFGQLVAFLTGCSKEYHYQVPKGKSWKDSCFKFVTDFEGSTEKSTAYFADKSVCNALTKQGHGAFLNKSTKLVQIFQGLTDGPETGIVYDDPRRKGGNLKLWWTTMKAPKIKQWEIRCIGIVPNKRILGKHPFLPRVVNDYVGLTENSDLGLNGNSKQRIYRANGVLRGDRKIPKHTYYFHPHEVIPEHKLTQKYATECANKLAAKPIVNFDDGSTLEHGPEELKKKLVKS